MALIGSFYMEEGSSGFIVTERVYSLKFISPLKLSNYWHHRWKAGCTAKTGLKSWWPMKSRSCLFGPSLEPVYYCNSVSVLEKPSSYGQDSIHSPQIVVFSVFGQFWDLDLRQNIFNPIIFIWNKKLPWAVWFGFISGILFPLYSERKTFVSKPSPAY